MKHIITLVLFAAPFIVSAQEQPANSTKKTNTPPSTEKSISEKGVSSTKSRSVTPKKTESHSTAPTAPAELQPAPVETKTATGSGKKPN